MGLHPIGIAAVTIIVALSITGAEEIIKCNIDQVNDPQECRKSMGQAGPSYSFFQAFMEKKGNLQISGTGPVTASQFGIFHIAKDIETAEPFASEGVEHSRFWRLRSIWRRIMKWFRNRRQSFALKFDVNLVEDSSTLLRKSGVVVLRVAAGFDKNYETNDPKDAITEITNALSNQGLIDDNGGFLGCSSSRKRRHPGRLMRRPSKTTEIWCQDGPIAEGEEITIDYVAFKNHQLILVFFPQIDQPVDGQVEDLTKFQTVNIISASVESQFSSSTVDEDTVL